MGRPYHSNSQKNISTVHKNDTEALARFLTRNGQALLPMVELIEQSQLAVDELIDVLGRASVEAVLRFSAAGIAGPPHPGKKGGAVGWHGSERDTVALAERKLSVTRPRLRKKDQGQDGEVPVPAYEAMQLVLNSGSSSQKACLYEIGEALPNHPPAPLWEGRIEWSGDTAAIAVKNSKGIAQKEKVTVSSREQALRHLLSTASLSALSYAHNLTEPVIRLWNDDYHVAT